MNIIEVVDLVAVDMKLVVDNPIEIIKENRNSLTKSGRIKAVGVRLV